MTHGLGQGPPPTGCTWLKYAQDPAPGAQVSPAPGAKLK